MVRRTKNKEIYILDDGKENYRFDKEMELLECVKNIKEILMHNKKNNMIYCLEHINVDNRNGYNYKIYMLINEQYNSKEEVLNSIKIHKKNGFRAYPIL